MPNMIRFVISGIEHGVQQLGKMRAAVNGVQKAAKPIFPTAQNPGPLLPPAPVVAGKVGAGGGGFGKTLARLGAGAGMGGLGQVGSALGSPLGALGVAAVGIGLSFRALGGAISTSIEAIKSEVQVRHKTIARVRDAGSTADQSAVGAVMGRKDSLVGKSGRGGTPEVQKFFADQEKVQKQIEAAQLNRALKVGDRTAREELTKVVSPEAVALGEAFKEAQAQTAALQEIRDNMNWFQKAYEGIGNQLAGRSWDAKGIDAMRNEAATVGGL